MRLYKKKRNYVFMRRFQSLTSSVVMSKGLEAGESVERRINTFFCGLDLHMLFVDERENTV